MLNLEQPADDDTRTVRPVTAHRRRWKRVAIVCLVGVPVAVLVVGVLQQGRPYDAARPPADAEPGRWVWLEGAENTRDIGGYPTRDGRAVRRAVVYRSGTLSHVTDAGCRAFRELGVVTVIDFRNRLSPLPLYNGDVLGIHRAAKVYGCPMSFRTEEPWQEHYVRAVRENAASFRRAFELLAEPGRLPLLYHCRDGSDRTGVMTALVLTLLGVDRETVIADFRLSERVANPGSLGAMERLLGTIESSGGIERFLTDLGVPPAMQERIREQLLTGPDQSAQSGRGR